MSKKRFETDKTPQVLLEKCDGELILSGGGEAAVMVSGRQYEADQNEKGIVINSRDSLSLRVPHGASVTISHIQGSVVVKNLEGELNLAEAGGSIVLKNVGAVTIGTAHNNLVAKNVNGPLAVQTVHHDVALRNSSDLQLGTIHGDLAGRFINGAVSIEEVVGDVSLRTVNGDLSLRHGRRDVNLRNLGGKNQVENIMGDIRLVGGLASGKHHFNANGDIILSWPEGSPLNLAATAPQIQNRLNLQDVSEKEDSLHGRIGDGETTLVLEAHGRIVLKKAVGDLDAEFEDLGFGAGDFNFGFNFEGIGEHIVSEVNSRMADLATRIEKKFVHKWEAKTQQAAEQAEEAMRRAEKAMKQARWQGEHRAWTPAAPPAPPAPAKSAKERKASGEEQLKILQMVEKGIISPEEASALLEALDN
jgi:hypothetical protein